MSVSRLTVLRIACFAAAFLALVFFIWREPVLLALGIPVGLGEGVFIALLAAVVLGLNYAISHERRRRDHGDEGTQSGY